MNRPFTPQDFISKWKRVTAREKQTHQEHFIDLCHLVGHQTPNDYDPTGTHFGFEMGATKTSGGQGDEAVFAAYGWKSELSDEEILEKVHASILATRPYFPVDCMATFPNCN